MKQIVLSLFALSLFATSALAQSSVPLGPSGGSGSGGGGATPGGTSGQLQTNNGAGGFGAVAAPSGAVVGTTDTQSLTNKSIAGSEVNSGTVPLAQMPTVYTAPPYITGASMYYLNPLTPTTVTGGAVGVANSYYCTPFLIYQTVTIKALVIHVSTTSAGNSNGALQGAVYNDLVTTGNVHRPGTLIDYTANFATGSIATVAAAMNNTTDSINGPGIVWGCLQHFDTTAIVISIPQSSSIYVSAIIGTQTLVNSIPAVALVNSVAGVSTTGTGYGGVNWVNFTSATSWSEINSAATAPVMAIEVN